MQYPEIIQARLCGIIAETEGADGLSGPGGFGLTRADERRIKDNHGSGRYAFQKARMMAWRGLDALDQDDPEAAQDHLCEALVYMVTALRAAVTQSQIADLLKHAGSRGSRPSDRNRRLVAAVLRQEANDLTGQEAINAALKADPKLAAECRDMKPDTIARAVQRARKTTK